MFIELWRTILHYLVYFLTYPIIIDGLNFSILSCIVFFGVLGLFYAVISWLFSGGD